MALGYGIYYTNRSLNTVIYWDPITGKSETVAGDGVGNTKLNMPYGLALDGQRRLYIADKFNHRILRRSSGVVEEFFAGGDYRHEAGILRSLLCPTGLQ